MKIIRIKVNVDLPGHPAGSVVRVTAHDDGTPVSSFWRRRLRDSVIDGCCEIMRPDEEGEE